jgi:hypothetical protein
MQIRNAYAVKKTIRYLGNMKTMENSTSFMYLFSYLFNDAFGCSDYTHS